MRLIAVALLGLVLWPVDADAQRRPPGAGATPGASGVSMTPYMGVYFDPVVQEDRQSGLLVGLRVAYRLDPRFGLLADAGYSEVNGAGAVSSDEEEATRFVYGNDWIFALAGAEVVLLRGSTSGSLTVTGGVGWRKNEIETRVVGDAPEPEVGGWGSFGVLAPGVVLTHRLGARSELRLSFQDYIVDFDEDPEHAPVLTAGIRFR